MLKVVTIVGARPQLIKASVVSSAMRSTGSIVESMVHTGQHYDRLLSDIFFQELDILPPERDLGIGSAPHGAQTGRMLEAIEATLLELRPDWVLVYGDTNSTLAGALAAAKLGIPLAHVEAGLRSFNRRMPEEINRVIADHVSEILFAPTAVSVRNLRNEGILAPRIKEVGDVMYDAVLWYSGKAERSSDVLERLDLKARDYVLATVHRAENTDDGERLSRIFDALGEIATEMTVVCPLHPRTQKALQRHGHRIDRDGLRLMPPVGYLDMLVLTKRASVVATDSGGLQKEAYFHRVPCVTLREETEWTELLDLGWNRLAPPTGQHDIGEAIRSARDSSPRVDSAPFGRGDSSRRIVEILLGTAIP